MSITVSQNPQLVTTTPKKSMHRDNISIEAIIFASGSTDIQKRLFEVISLEYNPVEDILAKMSMWGRA